VRERQQELLQSASGLEPPEVESERGQHKRAAL